MTRGELALLAGISADYVTRLEQGRADSPSGQVVEALARALRLSADERARLFHLAGLVPPGSGIVPTRITPGVQRILDRLSGTPVAVYDAAWTLLVANQPYAALMGDPSRRRGPERNAIWRHFLGERGRTRHTPESLRDFEARLAADLRTTVADYPDDPRVRRLVADLRASSPRFAALWERADVATHDASRKTIDHPTAGPITLDCDILTVSGTGLHIMIYTAPPGSDDADRLALLTVLGTQSLTG